MGFCVGHVVMRFNSFSFFNLLLPLWGDDCARADFNSKNYSRGWKCFFFCFFFVLQSASSHMTPNVVSTHLTGSVWSWSDAVTSASNPIAKVREGSLNLCCYTQLNDLVVDELSRNWSHNSHTHRIVSPFRRAAADVHWLVSCNFHHLDLLYTQLRTLYNTETIQWNSSCCCIYDCERLGNVKRKGMKQCRLVLCQWNIK